MTAAATKLLDFELDGFEAATQPAHFRGGPLRGRRVFVELAPQASQAMRRYFAEAGTPVVV